jgi:hypothetical protein
MLSSIQRFLFSLLLLVPAAAHADGLQLDYLGHISMPEISWDEATFVAGKHFGYSPGVFCYVPERDSFLVVGRREKELIAEISNPGPGKQAKLLHDFVDVTGGSREAVSKRVGHPVQINALLYDRGRVILAAEKYYNVNAERIRTHASFAPDLDKIDFDGWWRVGDHLGQTSAFYMTRLPDRYVKDGYWLLTGGSVSWRSTSSPGPCAVLAAAGNGRPDTGEAVSAQTLLRYQIANPQRKINLTNPEDRRVSLNSGGVEGWMGGCRIGGVVAIENRLIYFGRQGDGFDFYGPAQEYRKLTGLDDPFDGKGYRCGPYKAAMWIYNLDDLFAGNRSVARVAFPWALSPKGTADLSSACVHGDRLYVAEAGGELAGSNPVPVIHVLRIRGADRTVSKK